MIIGGRAQVNNENQFPSQKKISENSRPSVSSTVPRRVFLQRLEQERHLQRIIDDVANYFVPVVIFIAISGGVGWYLVGVTGATFSVSCYFFTCFIFFCYNSWCCPFALSISSS